MFMIVQAIPGSKHKKIEIEVSFREGKSGI
jgi:hypothetical protein